ncbi:Fc.00g042880.m01.CDS01 [Cosmosporella sp. VM-42]
MADWIPEHLGRLHSRFAPRRPDLSPTRPGRQSCPHCRQIPSSFQAAGYLCDLCFILLSTWKRELFLSAARGICNGSLIEPCNGLLSDEDRLAQKYMCRVCADGNDRYLQDIVTVPLTRTIQNSGLGQSRQQYTERMQSQMISLGKCMNLRCAQDMNRFDFLVAEPQQDGERYVFCSDCRFLQTELGGRDPYETTTEGLVESARHRLARRQASPPLTEVDLPSPSGSSDIFRCSSPLVPRARQVRQSAPRSRSGSSDIFRCSPASASGRSIYEDALPHQAQSGNAPFWNSLYQNEDTENRSPLLPQALQVRQPAPILSQGRENLQSITMMAEEAFSHQMAMVERICSAYSSPSRYVVNPTNRRRESDEEILQPVPVRYWQPSYFPGNEPQGGDVFE